MTATARKAVPHKGKLCHRMLRCSIKVSNDASLSKRKQTVCDTKSPSADFPRPAWPPRARLAFSNLARPVWHRGHSRLFRRPGPLQGYYGFVCHLIVGTRNRRTPIERILHIDGDQLGLCELLRTDSAHDWRQYCRMTKQKKRNSRESPRTTIASVKREMRRPRLTESVRNHGRDPESRSFEESAARPEPG
jgi:hypothetical protein